MRFSYALAIADRYGSKIYIAPVIDTESFELLDDDSVRTLTEKTRSEAVRKITGVLEPDGLPPDRYQIVVAEGVVFEALVHVFIILLFISAITQLALAIAITALFITSMLCLISALILLIADINLSLTALKLEIRDHADLQKNII